MSELLSHIPESMRLSWTCVKSEFMCKVKVYVRSEFMSSVTDHALVIIILNTTNTEDY